MTNGNDPLACRGTERVVRRGIAVRVGGGGSPCCLYAQQDGADSASRHPQELRNPLRIAPGRGLPLGPSRAQRPVRERPVAPATYARNVKTVLNVVWLVLAGLWLALGYLLAAILLAITIVGLPFAKQSLKLARYALWPFGRALVQSPDRLVTLSAIGNVLWFILAGWWLALGHVVTGVALCLTIIGIPLGIADFKMAGAALVPFGRTVVRAKELNAGMVSADSAIRFPH